jgi:hypothetical protein
MNQPAPTPNPKIDLADVLQRFSSKVLWHFTGYNKSWDDAFRIQNEILQSNLLQVGKQSETIVMNSEIDSSQSSNFYYEREWRTVFPWKFNDASVAAIMMPQRFLADFQKRWGNRFVNSSIISSEMIETL